MKQLSFIFILSCLLVLSSCGKSNQNSVEVTRLPEPNAKQSSKTTTQKSEKLIKEADISFETNDIETTAIQVRLIAKAHKAYMDEENRYEYTSETGYNMTIRVPETEFDSFIQEILANADIKKLNNKTIRVSDVTAEYIDNETRLKVKKDTEAHYLELMKQAHNLSETVALEKQLSDIRSEIESMEGRMKFLTNQVDYSTVNLNFSNRQGLSVQFFSEIRSAFKGGWQVFLKVIIGLAYLWVFIPVFFILRFIYIRIRRNRKRKKSAGNS